MRTWLERCHLDTLRRAVAIEPDRTGEGIAGEPVTDSLAGPGDCLVLEDGQAEAPIPVGVYLADEGIDRSRFAAFAPYWPTRENLSLPIHELSPPVSPPGAASPRSAHGRGFTLRRT